MAKNVPTFTPYSPVIRPGHFDHIPDSIRPPDIDEDDQAHHHLQRSSSSLLDEVETPPSTPSEEEAGTVGIHFLCLGKKLHHVDHKLEKPKIADEFGIRVCFIIILSLVPAFLIQLAYVLEEKKKRYFMYWIVEHYNLNFIIFWVLFIINLIMKYFCGLARHYPFHLIMIAIKSTLFAMLYTLAAGGVDYLFILWRMEQKNHYRLIDDGKVTWIELLNHYLKEEAVTGSDFQHIVHSDKSIQDEPWKNIMFLYGITYSIILLTLLLVFVKYTKLHFFGPLFPFVSYSFTLVLILLSTVLIMGGKLGDLAGASNAILWELLQCIMGPIIGSAMTELFIVFLDNLLKGKLCPLKFDEYMYAAAHY